MYILKYRSEYLIFLLFLFFLPGISAINPAAKFIIFFAFVWYLSYKITKLLNLADEEKWGSVHPLIFAVVLLLCFYTIG